MTEIGEIPSEWQVRKLGEITIGKGEYGIGASATEYIEGKPRYLRITDIGDSCRLLFNEIKGLDDADYEKYILKEGDIVFARTGNTTGKGYVYNREHGELVYAGFLIKYSIDNNIAKHNFIKYVIQSKRYWDWVNIMSTRSGQPGINSNEYSSFIVQLPPLKEQEKIASILSTVDEQIDNVDALIEKNKELKKGLMQTLLTKGIGHTKFKKTEIGEIPEEWEVVKFKEITDILRCGVASTPTYVENGIPFLSAQNVNNEKLSLHKYNFISEDYHKQLTKNDKPQKGDILYSRVGANYGIAAVVDIDFEFSVYVSLTLIRMKSEYDSRFYKYLLNSTIIRKQADIGVFQGGGVPNLNVKVVEKFNVVVPSKYEQTRIATILSEVDEKIEEYENKKQKLEELKKGLMQQLLSGNIRVS